MRDQTQDTLTQRDSDRTLTPDTKRLDRSISRIVAVSGLPLTAIWMFDEMNLSLEITWWWRMSFVVPLAVFTVLAVAPAQLTYPRMRALWLTTAVFGGLLLLATFPAGRGYNGRSLWDSSWLLVGIYLCFAALRFPGAHALLRINLLAAAYAVLPVISHLIAYGTFEDWMPRIVATIYSNVGYAMLLILFRRRLIAFTLVQARWQNRTTAAAVAATRIREEAKLSRLAHDRVLGTLNAASLWGSLDNGPIPQELKDMTLEAFTLLDERVGVHSNEQSTDLVRSTLESTALALDSAYTIKLTSDGKTVPTDCAVALVDATSEALRNSVRHASGSAHGLHGEITHDLVRITVSDAGAGFTPEDVPEDRLGMRHSIVGQLKDVKGASVEIETTPGSGTQVRLTWERRRS